ncbi:MAG TPA: trypsin-like serine protease [Candidatus Margulisiibacteriota bacterium]|nr:trypsin-like serine protease [Candidatus Margulisiibacteriota bacterium]
MRRARMAVCAATLLMFLTAIALADGPSAPAATPGVVERIVNGNVTADFPSTGALLMFGNPDSAGLECSGTLIGCQTFLTAGHCVADDLNPNHYTVFFQHAGFFSVSSIALHPDFNFPVGDVAVLKLGSAVNGIRPTPINTTAAPATGVSATIVGFGRTGGVNQDYGIKRVGSVVTATCTRGVSGTTSVCWNFSPPLGAPGTNSNTCNGDSGGPLFIDFGSGARVAGVTSGGNADNCLPSDNSFDANVFFYRSWIQDQAGSDLGNTACGSLPQVGDTDTNVFAFTDQLSGAVPTATHSFQVVPGTSVLRVTMNAIDDGSDFDLFVKAGTPPTMSSYDCRQNGPGQFASCAFQTPAAGTWYALVVRSAGSGPYQVTATTFTGGCADPANAGKSCDDNNPCTINDHCQAGSCVGTAADGMSCDDGNPCTQGDTCQAGTCQGSLTPRTDCHAPFVVPSGLFRLQVTLPGQPSTSDKLTWEWWRGSATDKQEFGDPLSTTNYDLCVFEETAGSTELLMSEHVGASATCGSKPCWKSSKTSFTYTDRKLRNGPISSLFLKAGVDGKARITLKGKGTGLGLPALPLQNAVTVQLSNGAACWQGHYENPTRNDILEFNARAN